MYDKIQLTGTYKNVFFSNRKDYIYKKELIGIQADISAVGAHCNFEELQKLVNLLDIEIGKVGLANGAEAKLFEQNPYNRL